MNKTIRRIVALVICVILMLSLTGCGEYKQIKDINQICVAGCYIESWMYVIVDEEAIDELVQMYNSLEFEETDATVNMSSGEDIYAVSFNEDHYTKATFVVDSNNNFMFKPGEQVYHITSDFDYARFSEIIETQIEAIQAEVE